MKKTTQYQLNQWEQSDRIMREDFNADNQKVEQALAGQAETLTAVSAAVAKCGNCKIVYGSYTGNGKYGSGNKNTLTFAGKPILLAVFPNSTSGTSPARLIAVRGAETAFSFPEYFNSANQMIWGGNSIQWYCAGGVDYQFNSASKAYYYMALLAADE